MSGPLLPPLLPCPFPPPPTHHHYRGNNNDRIFSSVQFVSINLLSLHPLVSHVLSVQTLGVRHSVRSLEPL